MTVLGRDRKFALRPLILDVEAHFRAECGEDHDGASGIERAVAEAITKERSR